MNAEWPQVSLRDITSILGDGLHGTPKYDESGEYYFINGNNLSDGKIVITEKTKRASKSEYLKHKKDLNNRTILVSINGTLGNIAFYNGEKVFLGKSACYFNVKPDIDKHFVRYVLESRLFQDYIHNLATGSTIKNVSLKLMREFSFRLPPNKLQQSISSILKNLDDKIQLNRQINQTLEQMAQAIFKSWFVDFEPVKAKIAARERWQALQPGNESASPACYAGELAEQPFDVDLDTYMNLAAMQAISGKDADQLARMQAEQPEQYADLHATAELFPSALQNSELGDIPEGWTTPELKGETEALRGFSYKGKGLSETGTPMHNLNSILEGGGYKYSGIKHYSLDYRSKFEVRAGDVLVANTEQGHDHKLIGYGAAVPHFYMTGIFSHHVYRLRPKEGASVTPEFLAALFNNDRFVMTVQGYANGTTVNMLPAAGVELPRFVCPPLALAERYSALARPMRTLAETNHLEGLSLASTRDTLLPKLLSGELTLPYTEEPLHVLQDVAHV